MNSDIKIKVIAVSLLATALTASSPARADTIFLICGGNDFTVDLSKNTVNNEPAAINPTAIDWEVILIPSNEGTSGTLHNHIDRTTATYTSSVTYVSRGGGNLGTVADTKPCALGSPPRPKF